MIEPDTIFEKSNAIATMYQEMQEQQQHTTQSINELRNLLVDTKTSIKDDKFDKIVDNFGKIMLGVATIIFIPIFGYFWKLNSTISILEQDNKRYQEEITDIKKELQTQNKQITILEEKYIVIREIKEKLNNTPQNKFIQQGYTNDYK